MVSAFVVSKEHLDYLIRAGLELERRNSHAGSPLRWMARELTEEDERGAYARGEPWGPTAVRLYNELRRELTPETASQVGQMLWAENVRSVNHRYSEDDWEQVYEYERRGLVPEPVQVLKALACFEYQSCEHPEWRRSEAHAFVQALEARVIRCLPGYDEAAWEISWSEAVR